MFVSEISWYFLGYLFLPEEITCEEESYLFEPYMPCHFCPSVAYPHSNVDTGGILEDNYEEP